MITWDMLVVYVAAHSACVLGNLLALIALILCLKKKREKSAGAIGSGVIAALLGASVMLICDRPLPNFEEALFYWSAVPVLLGVTTLIIEISKKRKTTS